MLQRVSYSALLLRFLYKQHGTEMVIINVTITTHAEREYQNHLLG